MSEIDTDNATKREKFETDKTRPLTTQTHTDTLTVLLFSCLASEFSWMCVAKHTDC